MTSLFAPPTPRKTRLEELGDWTPVALWLILIILTAITWSPGPFSVGRLASHIASLAWMGAWASWFLLSFGKGRPRKMAVLNIAAASGGANPTAVADPSADSPRAPALLCLLCFCAALSASASLFLFAESDEVWRNSTAEVIMWFLGDLLLMLAAMGTVSRDMRRLYIWALDRASIASRIRTDADKATLEALQAQINPHFLFNALNTVASLLGSDGARAKRTADSLSLILQKTLNRSSQPLTTLADELEFVREYLDIERERYGSRLHVMFTVDPACMQASVPTMSLQPLVENAVKHAVAARIEGASIGIVATRRENRLILSVRDDGPGFADRTAGGSGLANLTARLKTLYGDGTWLDVVPNRNGVLAELSLPIS